jgi:glycyl-tRNA synthetase beta chain
MKGEFLLEIGTEEIPAGFFVTARESLLENFAKALDAAHISHGAVNIYATPRRIILSVSDIAVAQDKREVEKTGPPRSSAFDEKGNPTKAAIGFARSQGVEVSDLIVVKTTKGEQIAVRKMEGGLPTAEVLSNMLPELLEKISFPKTMRWMDLDVRFARPIHWIVAIFEGKIVTFAFGNIESGDFSRGHRFTSPAPFKVSSLKDLRETLSVQGVIIDPEDRKMEIRNQIGQLANEAGLRVVDDEELLDEVTFLVESPYPVMGRFPKEFLELPAPILMTCMKKHQRYFSIQDKNDTITNRFVAVNNTPVKNTQISIAGHERVLKARLEDARFYFREDTKEPLGNRLEALKGVVFHSRLGTAFEKVQRFKTLALKLGELYSPDKIQEIERAALLCKCDLETGIVYEFPELQGIIGSRYAAMDGELDEVSTAIREHYLPSHSGDNLPEGIIGSLISISDRIDTIVGCFSVGLIPTGAADPYALRRHVLAIIQIIIGLDKALDLRWLVRESLNSLAEKRTRDPQEVEEDVMEFIRTRFVNFHTSQGFSLDAVEAAVRARFDDILDARRRVEALAEWKTRSDFDSIIIGFKRVVNILKSMPHPEFSEKRLIEPEEKELFRAFKVVAKQAEPLVNGGDYAKALQILAELKGPIDLFFDKVMVMVEDETLRNNRLGLLRKIAGFFERIADFSFIGSTAETK